MSKNAKARTDTLAANPDPDEELDGEIEDVQDEGEIEEPTPPPTKKSRRSAKGKAKPKGKTKAPPELTGFDYENLGIITEAAHRSGQQPSELVEAWRECLASWDKMQDRDG